jgi:hypothetical protein
LIQKNNKPSHIQRVVVMAAEIPSVVRSPRAVGA